MSTPSIQYRPKHWHGASPYLLLTSQLWREEGGEMETFQRQAPTEYESPHLANIIEAEAAFTELWTKFHTLKFYGLFPRIPPPTPTP